MKEKILAPIIVGVITFLATLAWTGANGVTRAEVQRMVSESENRMMLTAAQATSRQEQILDKLENLSQEQVRLSTKVDLLIRGQIKQ